MLAYYNKELQCEIYGLWRAGHNQTEIAKEIGVHKATISRELKRSFKLNQNKTLRDYIFDKLKLSWSPEQIAGRLKLENQGKSLICHETIYAYLYIENYTYFREF